MAESVEYDVAILGSGYGGLIAGMNLKRGGVQKIVMIDKRGLIGGTCLYEGCIPSKALLNSSQKFFECKNEFAKHGVMVDHVTLDFNKMQKKKEDLLTLMSGNNMKKVHDIGIEFKPGFGRLLSKNEIEVDNNGQKTILKAKTIILNMGGESTPLPGNVIPIDKKVVITSNEALSLPTLPKKMIVIGAGFIGLELGSHFTKLGVDVTIVEFFDRVLPMLDKELSAGIQPILEHQGMKFLLSTKVTGGEVSQTGAKVQMEDAKGGNARTLDTEIVFIATGRRPLTKGIGLEEVGVELDKFGRVVINDLMQSNIPNIYAVGDITNKGAPLAHKAEDEALALVDQYFKRPTHINYGCIPIVVYVHPEVASVGKTEENLIQEKISYKKGIQKLIGNPRAKCNDETDGFIKILADTSNKILGVHMIGPQVGEQVQQACMCVEYGTSVELISRMSHSHPSFGEAFKDACSACWKSEPIKL